MRIVFFADSLDKQYGGIHVYTKELLRALTNTDTSNEYIILRASDTKEFPNAKEIAIPYSTAFGHRVWRIFYKFPKIAKDLKADIVVEPAHFGPFNLPKRIKRVTVIHDLTMFLFPAKHVYFSQLLQRLFLPKILKSSAQIITNSLNTKKDLIRHFPSTKHKTNLTLLGKNKRFSPVPNHMNVLQKYGITRPYVLCTATFEPRKNLPVLIQAFNELKSNNDFPHQLILIGEKGWKTKPIFDAIEQSAFKKDIKHLGYVPIEHLSVLYTKTDVFVYPSLYEGFGLPVLEAMSCGAPVLISNTSSLPEVGGDAAEYFSPNSVTELSKKLLTICSNSTLRQSMRQKSLIQASNFSWEKTALKTIAIFEKLQSNVKAAKTKSISIV